MARAAVVKTFDRYLKLQQLKTVKEKARENLSRSSQQIKEQRENFRRELSQAIEQL